MYNKLKFIIIIFTVVILLITLSTPIILENVVLKIQDALIIVFFTLSSIMTLKMLSYMNEVKLQKKLNSYNAQIKTIFDNVNWGMYLKDTNGVVCVANQFYADFLNCPLNNIVGKKTYGYYGNPDQIINEDKILIERKSVMIMEKEIERVGGEKIWYRINKIPVLDSAGVVSHIIVIFKDITNEKLLEEKKDTFVAMLTHDLKTPTVAQIKSLDLLLKSYFGKLSEEQVSIVEQIKHSCEYMYNLISTILDSYKYDCGQFVIEYSSFNLKDLLSETIRDLEALYSDRRQIIKVKTDMGKDIISADKFQIKRVIMNLLSNAIKYGNKDSEIEIILTEKDNNAKLQIVNQSNYISKEQMSEMFKKYKSNRNSKVQTAGTGLGLYLSKKIIDAHKGCIYADSKETGICIFGFSIPCSKSSVKVSESLN